MSRQYIILSDVSHVCYCGFVMVHGSKGRDVILHDLQFGSLDEGEPFSFYDPQFADAICAFINDALERIPTGYTRPKFKVQEVEWLLPQC